MNRLNDLFAYNCLIARRLLERGTRFVQLMHSGWDQHGNLFTQLEEQCRDTDLPSSALVRDLKQRGLLEDTLVAWGGEFGRTPFGQGNHRIALFGKQLPEAFGGVAAARETACHADHRDLRGVQGRALRTGDLLPVAAASGEVSLRAEGGGDDVSFYVEGGYRDSLSDDSDAVRTGVAYAIASSRTVRSRSKDSVV